MILHRLQRGYRIGIGCRRRPIKIPDFQPIFNILLPKCFASGALPRTPLGGGLPAPPDPQLRHVAEGPTEMRAPGARDPTIRHWVLVRHKRQWHGHNRCGSAVIPSLIAVAPLKSVKTADLRGGTAETLTYSKLPQCYRGLG